MIVPTAPTLEGRRIVRYVGLVPGEAAMGADIFRDLFAAVRDIVGVRAGTYERCRRDARDAAIGEMTDGAASWDATRRWASTTSCRGTGAARSWCRPTGLQR